VPFVLLQLISPLLLTDVRSSKEKKYAHYLAEASWAGARIVQGQQTPQAQDLYNLLISTFSTDQGKPCDLEALREQAGLSADAWEDLLQYTIQVRIRNFPTIVVNTEPTLLPGVEQPRQLQVLWVHKNCASSSRGQV
jgi:hypothetical protein